MKITMYELLGMVKDGKAPKKIKYENREYDLYDNKSYLTTDKTRFFDRIYFSDLNVEVEILEEETTVSEEQVLFNNLTTIDQEYVIRIMKMLQQPIDYLKIKGDE